MKFFNSLGFLSHIFNQMGWIREKSGSLAKERLRLVLIHDQAKVSPELLDTIRSEMIGVISKYMEIDTEELEVGLEQRNGSVAIAANIPIIRLKREKVAEALKNHNSSKVAPHYKGERRIIKRTKKSYPAKDKTYKTTTSVTP